MPHPQLISGVCAISSSRIVTAVIRNAAIRHGDGSFVMLLLCNALDDRLADARQPGQPPDRNPGSQCLPYRCMLLESAHSDHGTLEFVGMNSAHEKAKAPRFTGVFVHTTTYHFVVQGWHWW